MAALLDDRELHSFKLFAGRRRAEYALRFPFLTERQIAAKLRRVWQSRKGERIGISTGRKRDQGTSYELCFKHFYLSCMEYRYYFLYRHVFFSPTPSFWRKRFAKMFWCALIRVECCARAGAFDLAPTYLHVSLIAAFRCVCLTSRD